MRHSLIGGILAVLLTCTVAAHAQADEKGADDLAVEGISKLIDALSVFLDSIPQYDTPELLENGDIIIRRKQKTEEEEEKDTDIEKTST